MSSVFFVFWGGGGGGFSIGDSMGVCVGAWSEGDR